MRPFRLLRSAQALIAALALIGTWNYAAAAPDSLLHRPAPQFVRTDLNGMRIDLSAYRGRVVLLTFWATWCAPCQIEMPHFIAWQNRYGGEGLQILAVSMDDDSAPVRTLIRKRRVNYPVVMGDEPLGTEYGGILGLPITFLIDRQGNIVEEFKGEGKIGAMQRELIRLLKTR